MMTVLASSRCPTRGCTSNVERVPRFAARRYCLTCDTVFVPPEPVADRMEPYRPYKD